MQPIVPFSVQSLYACDPGRTNLMTITQARELGEAERLAKFSDLQPTGDGKYVVWKKVLVYSKAQYNHERGFKQRQLQFL